MNDINAAKDFNFGTTRTEFVAQVRNDGIREALTVLRWFPASARVEMATRILLESCHRQARLLP